MNDPGPDAHAFTLDVTATLRDTDANGHVNNAVYVTWLEEIRTRYVFERRGLDRAAQIDFVLARTEIDHVSPVWLHEVVDLYCRPSRVGSRSWDMDYAAYVRSDGRVALRARSVQVHYDHAAARSAPIPEPFRAILERDRTSGG